jgi:D-amino-acid dehydrogenase
MAASRDYHDDPRQHIVVIGGGVIGVCAASWLVRDGHRVTLLEPSGIATGSSYGNAGCFNPSSVVPMSMPGNLLKVPGWILDPLGPLSIRWRYIPSIAPWLFRFLRSGTPERVAAQAVALGNLLRDSVGVFKPLVDNASAQSLVRRDGHLIVYPTRAHFDADALAWKLRRDNGIDFIVLEGDALWQQEPALSHSYNVGAFLPGNSHTTDPGRFVQTLADAFRRDGGEIVQARAEGFEFDGDRLSAVRTEGGEIACNRAVVAAGAHSRPLTKALGDRIPLDTERGYHIVIPGSSATPRIPVMDTLGKFVATPMEGGLRIAGTVEFAGLEAQPDWQRAYKLLPLARRLFPGLNQSPDATELPKWMGFRPSMPDSLPVIGRSHRSPHVIYAFGHGHVGMAAGAQTGLVVADLVAGRPPAFPLAPFSPQRFG